MVELMNAFNTVRSSVGCPIKAAFHCPTFVQFLDRKKCNALNNHKKKKEGDNNESDSES